MRRPIIALTLAVVVVAALIGSYATPLGAAAVRDLAGHLDARESQAPATSAAPAVLPDKAQAKGTEKKGAKEGNSEVKAQGAFLGLGVADTENGARITQVYVSGPAHQAGVKQGDIIKKVNGTAVADAKTMVAEAGKARPGDTVTLILSRGDSELTIEVVAGSPPSRGLPKILESPRAPELEGLGNLPLRQLFGSFISGQFTFEGKDGQRYTLKTIPGTVTEVTSQSITINPKDPQSERDYAITDKTLVYAGLAKSKAEQLKQGDQVVILVVDGNSNRATAILKTLPSARQFQKLIPNFPIR